jgi:hypothetical protein
MEPGSLPIGRLAPRSWSNLLGGSCALPRGPGCTPTGSCAAPPGCFQNGGVMADLTREVEDLRARTLVGSRAGRPKAAQVMNLHQTKGRETDATVLLLQSDEFHGYEAEPYPTGSRLLCVCLTRARERAHIVVPDTIRDLHGHWLPLIDACIAAQQAWSAVTSAASPRTAVQNMVVCRANASAAAAMWNSRHHRRTSGRRVGECASIWAE